MHAAGEQADGELRHFSLQQPCLKVPVRLTSFVGRRHELDAVRQQLLLPEVRLLTLAGSAGTGKTRLAIQAAIQSADLFEQAAMQRLVQ